jgi:flagellar FliL protein
MLGKLLPILLILIGVGGGIGAGVMLRPAPEPAAEGAHEAPVAEPTVDPANMPDYAKLNNQFVIPVVEKGRVAAMVILALSLEVEKGKTEEVFTREPKLRDVFLQILFDHANAGGFNGSFTDGANLILLRKSLLEAAKSVLGTVVSDVLISDIARQDN